jgi:hypothetical protein
MQRPTFVHSFRPTTSTATFTPTKHISDETSDPKYTLIPTNFTFRPTVEKSSSKGKGKKKKTSGMTPRPSQVYKPTPTPLGASKVKSKRKKGKVMSPRPTQSATSSPLSKWAGMSKSPEMKMKKISSPISSKAKVTVSSTKFKGKQMSAIPSKNTVPSQPLSFISQQKPNTGMLKFSSDGSSRLVAPTKFPFKSQNLSDEYVPVSIIFPTQSLPYSTPAKRKHVSSVKGLSYPIGSTPSMHSSQKHSSLINHTESYKVNCTAQCEEDLSRVVQHPASSPSRIFQEKIKTKKHGIDRSNKIASTKSFDLNRSSSKGMKGGQPQINSKAANVTNIFVRNRLKVRCDVTEEIPCRSK